MSNWNNGWETASLLPPASPPPPSYCTHEDVGSVSRRSTLTTATRHPGESAEHGEVATPRPDSAHIPTASSSATLLPNYGTNDPVVLSWRSNEPPPQPITERTTYSFSQLTHRSMLLLPPASSPDSRPLYHIAVETNCFRPASHITVVHRGASEHGVYVGEFEIGLPARHNRITMGPVAKMLGRPVLAWDHSPARFEHPRLRWAFDGVVLRWDPVFDVIQGRSRMSFRCTRPVPAKKKALRVLATFYPPDPLQALDGVRPIATLTVESEGHQSLDHILVTVLLLQQDCYFPT